MRKILIAIATLILILAASAPYLWNEYRVSKYDDRVAHVRQFKTDNWYLPDKIPATASKVRYKTHGWGMKGESVSFQLPDKEAELLRESILSKYGFRVKSDSARPEMLTGRNYEELVWATDESNHGSEGGIWFDGVTREFFFFHRQW